jgi:uncharacterized membrane protein
MAPNLFIWTLSRAIHILAVAFWLGGSIFLAVALLPALRKSLDPDRRVLLIAQVGRRFSRITWLLMGALAATGWVNLWSMGFRPEDFATSRGVILLVKLILFALILTLRAVHDFRLGPNLERLASAGRTTTTEYLRARQLSIWLARLNVLLGVAVVVLILIFRISS